MSSLLLAVPSNNPSSNGRRSGHENVVAKKLTSPYGSTERGWVKVKNSNYWRRESEREDGAEERAENRKPAEADSLTLTAGAPQVAT
jgi:hypothetical protein